jgi:hypothetical protein
MPEYSIQVHGIFHKNPDGTERQTIIRECREGEPVFFIPDLENPVDPSAVKVVRVSGEQIGYVEADKAERFKGLMSSGRIESGRIDEVYSFEDDPHRRGVRLCVEVRPASQQAPAPVAALIKVPPHRGMSFGAKLAVVMVTIVVIVVVWTEVTQDSPQISATAAAALAPQKGPAISVRFAADNPDRKTDGPYLVAMVREVHIGDTMVEVLDEMGKPLPQADQTTSAAGTVTIWHYFGPDKHDRYVTLTFVNGALQEVSQ